MAGMMPRRAGLSDDNHGFYGSFLLVAFAFAIVLFLLLHRSPEPAKSTPGAIQDTRIVPVQAVETKGGSQLTWRAEYRVVYFVAGREYAVWVDSGIGGESEPAVQLALPPSHPACTVRYDPTKPEMGIPECR